MGRLFWVFRKCILELCSSASPLLLHCWSHCQAAGVWGSHVYHLISPQVQLCPHICMCCILESPADTQNHRYGQTPIPVILTLKAQKAHFPSPPERLLSSTEPTDVHPWTLPGSDWALELKTCDLISLSSEASVGPLTSREGTWVVCVCLWMEGRPYGPNLQIWDPRMGPSIEVRIPLVEKCCYWPVKTSDSSVHHFLSAPHICGAEETTSLWLKPFKKLSC